MSQVKNSWVIKSNSGNIPRKEITFYLVYVALLSLLFGMKGFKEKKSLYSCAKFVYNSLLIHDLKRNALPYISALVVSLLIFRKKSLADTAELLLTLNN